MMRLALLALESPERLDLNASSILEKGPPGDETSPEIQESWLLLFAAIVYSRPDLVNNAALSQLERLLRQHPLAEGTCRIAGEVLNALVSTPFAHHALETVMRLLSEPTHPPLLYEVLIGSLRHAATWTGALSDVDALLRVAELDHLKTHRRFLIVEILEPCLYADARGDARLDRLIRLYEDPGSARYCAYYLNGKSGLPAALQNRFLLHGQMARRLGRERRRILIVHNINDGQGDEIVRCVGLMQALLDFNSELQIVLVTRRVYLYSHPRITAVSIEDRDRTRRLLDEPFDGMVSYFEPQVKEVNYDPELQERVENYRLRRRPFLLLSSRKGYNQFVYEGVNVDSRPLAGALGLDRRCVENNYETTFRLIAELGLPLRRGEGAPRSEWVLAGISWPEAGALWEELTARNVESRPVAVLSPFGGAELLKGHVSPEGVAAEVLRLVRERFYVVLMPNGASWGTAAMAEDAVSLLEAEDRRYVTLGPDPASRPEGMSRDVKRTSLSYPDYLMRLVIYCIHYADLVVTVEGWMMHAAYCLGKPYRVLMLAYSHPDEWHPYGRTRRQGVVPAATRNLHARAGEAPLVEQPRKFTFVFLLRQLGKAGLDDALPFLRSAATSRDRHIRQAATTSLGTYREAGTEADLVALLRDPSHEVRAAAAAALLQRSPEPSMPSVQLMAHLWIGQEERDWEPVLRLGEAARPVLELAANGDDPVVRREAARALRLLDFKSRGRETPEPSVHTDSPNGKGLRLFATTGGMRMFKLPLARWRTRADETNRARILILTPVKDAAAFIPGYCRRLADLTYPKSLISLGFLESDSRDETYRRLQERLPKLRRAFRKVGLWKKDFGFRIPPGLSRWAQGIQYDRRTILAKSRNHLLFRALDDEDWVLWLDVDVIEYPADILERILSTGKDIVQPHCVTDYGGPTFDRNAWRDHGRLHMDDLREEGELVELDAVGGTMLLVRADLHREGLIFPPSRYGKESPRARPTGEVETEGLGIMALDMGYRCWGMPRLEIKHGKW